MQTIQELLKEDGVEISSIDKKGNIAIGRDEYGDEVKVNLNKYRQNLKKNQVDFINEINTPDSAMEGGLSISDRLKLSLGNEQGKLNYLKSKKEIEDAAFNKDGDLVFKQNGLWKTVDKDGLGKGNYADMAQEFLADTADMVGFGTVIVPAVAAGVATSGLGSAAAGVAGKSLQVSLGKLVGTYEDSEKLQIGDMTIPVSAESTKDLAYELAAQAVGLGTPFAAKLIKTAGTPLYNKTLGPLVKGIGHKLEQADDAIRESITSMLSFASGAGDKASTILRNNPSKVSNYVSDLLTIGNKAGERFNTWRKSNVNIVENLLNTVSKQASKKYGASIDTIKSKLNGSWDLELSGNFKDILLKGGKIGEDSIEGLTKNPFFQTFFTTDKTGTLKMVSRKKLAEANFNNATEINDIYPRIAKIFNSINSMKGNPNRLSGEAGFKLFKEMQESVDDLVYNVLAKSRNNEASMYAAKQFSANIKNGLMSGFKNPELKSQFTKMQNDYVADLAFKNAANKYLQGGTGKLEDFINELFEAQNTKAYAAKGLQDIGYRYGMKDQVNDLLAREAAARFTSVLPNLKNLAGGPAVLMTAGAAVGSQAGGAAGAAMGVAAGAAAASPVIGSKLATGAFKTLDAMKLLNINNAIRAVGRQKRITAPMLQQVNATIAKELGQSNE